MSRAPWAHAGLIRLQEWTICYWPGLNLGILEIDGGLKILFGFRGPGKGFILGIQDYPDDNEGYLQIKI